MKKCFTSFLVLTISLSSFPPKTAFSQGSANPAEACFELLAEEIPKSPKLSSVDLSAIKKLSEDSINDSQVFDVSDYQKFKQVSALPIPKALDLPSYPYNLGSVNSDSSRWELSSGRSYKANRTNISSMIHNNGVDTPLDTKHFVPGEGMIDQKISGYFVDTDVVTFGKKTDYTYPWRSSAKTPSQDSYYPFGAPYADMREYILYSHHFSPEKGGGFLSCGLMHFVPSSDYSLRGEGDKEPISWKNLGGSSMQGTNMQTQLLEKTNGAKNMKFRAMDISVLVKAETFDSENRVDYSKDLLRSNILALGYDNNNSFVNEFHTFKIFDDIMSNPGAFGGPQNLWETMKAFIKTAKEKYDFGILKGDSNAGAFIPNSADNSLVNLFLPIAYGQSRAAYEEDFGGVYFGEGIPFDLVNKIDAVPDENLRLMLNNAVIAGSGGFYYEDDDGKMISADSSLNLSDRLSHSQKVENVEFLFEQVEKPENLDINNLEYKDISFGQTVIPVPDSRVKAILNKDYLDEELARLNRKRKELLAQAATTDDMTQEEKQAMRDRRSEIEENYLKDLERILNFEGKYKEFEVEELDLKQKVKHERISEDEFQQKMKSLYQEFQQEAKALEGKVDILKDDLDLSHLSESFTLSVNESENSSSEIIDKPADSIDYAQGKMKFYFSSLLFLSLAVLCGFALLKIITKKNI